MGGDVIARFKMFLDQDRRDLKMEDAIEALEMIRDTDEVTK